MSCLPLRRGIASACFFSICFRKQDPVSGPSKQGGQDMTQSLRANNQKIAAAVTFLAAGVLLVGLIYGKEFLVPIVIAVLLTGLISSAIVRLEKIGFPTWLATVIALSAGFLALTLVVIIFSNQTDAIAEAWPRYAERLEKLIVSLTAMSGPDLAAKITGSVGLADLSGPISQLADSAGTFVGNVGLIVMYTGFLLAERGHLTSKFGNLVADAKRAEDIQSLFESVSRGIRSYLWIKTIMSVMTGALCYAILRLYGVDFAEIWGLLIFLLNFIPTIGSIIGVIIPSIVALIQFDTAWPFVQVLVLMGCVQFVIGNLIEPKYMGETLDLSPFVVIVSLTFWGTIWGIEGAFLSVPITASIAIVCRHIPDFHWLGVLLSSGGQSDASAGPPEPAAPETSGFRFSWPFGKSRQDLEELNALRVELDTLKSERSGQAQTKGKSGQGAT
jgi:predicted PurR-regulated permease PerM